MKQGYGITSSNTSRHTPNKSIKELVSFEWALNNQTLETELYAILETEDEKEKITISLIKLMNSIYFQQYKAKISDIKQTSITVNGIINTFYIASIEYFNKTIGEVKFAAYYYKSKPLTTIKLGEKWNYFFENQV